MDQNTLKSILLGQLKVFETLDRGIQRELLSDGKITQKHPNAVVVSGIRRAGKSTLLAQIAKKYCEGQYYFVNFDDERFLEFKAQNFSQIHEALVELFGEKKIFIFDEIQNIQGWETFCRRLIDENYKLYISGSNASLLSKELGTRLTGRYVALELLPFSFREYLQFQNFPLSDLHESGTLTSIQKGNLLAKFNSYLQDGGIPMALKFPKLEVHKTLYENIIFRDIVSRYDLHRDRELRELSLYLLSNVAKPFAYNKLKGQLGLGSMTTVKNFIGYLENSWLFLTLNSFRFSLKDQTGRQASKKVYAIDTGLIQSLAFKITEDKGRLLENIVFLELTRKKHEIYFFKTKTQEEVDFYLKDEKMLIQVCTSVKKTETREREIKALANAMTELKIKKYLILTENEESEVKLKGILIKILPIYKWLLRRTT